MAYFLPNCSNILVTGTDKRLYQLQKCDISSNFHEELAKYCNFPIKKQTTRELLHEPISRFFYMNSKFEVKL